MDFTKKEELNEELQVYLEEDTTFFPMLRHPLVFGVPYFEQLNATYNLQLKSKNEAIGKAIKKKEWSHAIWLHERPYRLNSFIEYEPYLTDKEYWRLLSDIWVDSENIYSSIDKWRELLLSERKGREHLMSKEEIKALRALPEEFLIYRGGRTNKGFSWTLSESRAEWFANRFGEKHRVFKKKVKKSDVLAYLLGRDEEEIIFVSR